MRSWALSARGIAIYRANVGKLCRDQLNLRLSADRKAVFATPIEFREHHELGPDYSEERI